MINSTRIIISIATILFLLPPLFFFPLSFFPVFSSLSDIYPPILFHKSIVSNLFDSNIIICDIATSIKTDHLYPPKIIRSRTPSELTSYEKCIKLTSEPTSSVICKKYWDKSSPTIKIRQEASYDINRNIPYYLQLA